MRDLAYDYAVIGVRHASKFIVESDAPTVSVSTWNLLVFHEQVFYRSGERIRSRNQGSQNRDLCYLDLFGSLVQ